MIGVLPVKMVSSNCRITLTQPVTEYLIFFLLDGPHSGDVRLFYSYYIPDNYYGRVEVFLSEAWGTVIANSWTQENGEVVCRQLGYNYTSKIAK